MPLSAPESDLHSPAKAGPLSRFPVAQDLSSILISGLPCSDLQADHPTANEKTPQKAVIHFLAAFYLHPGLFIVSRLFLLRSFFCVSLPFRLPSPAQAFQLSGCFTSKTVLFFAYPRLDKDLKKIRCFFTHLILITILNLPPYLTKSQKKSAEPMPCR